VPLAVSALVEPVLGVLADTRHRRALVTAGGLLFAAGWIVAALAAGFPALLVGLVVVSPASGAFVALPQATLMDALPAERERAMARWTLAGSFGVVGGPLLLAGAIALGLGWRPLLLVLALAAPPLALAARRLPVWSAGHVPAREAARGALGALREREVLRQLALLQLANPLLDGLNGFLALYLVDVAGASVARAALGVAVWTGAGLVGDALLLLVLRRVRGTTVLRSSAVAVTAVYPAFLLVPGFGPKLVPLALLGLLTAGWYALPKAGLYEQLEGRSGAAVALGSLADLAGVAVPLAVGAVAASAGLASALWLALVAPLGLLALLRSRAG
jgi:FSR family fosmidomycin resistance protein-like MFS transporter